MNLMYEFGLYLQDYFIQTGSDDDKTALIQVMISLAPNSHQAITWTNDDQAL